MSIKWRHQGSSASSDDHITHNASAVFWGLSAKVLFQKDTENIFSCRTGKFRGEVLISLDSSVWKEIEVFLLLLRILYKASSPETFACFLKILKRQ